MIDAIAAIGDAGDVNCWSGIPHHFGDAARRRGEPARPWRLDMPSFAVSRRWWNARRMLTGRGRGGYQYSASFRNKALATIPDHLKTGRVLSFNQHFPPVEAVCSRGGRVCFYLDATFPLLLERYGLKRSISWDAAEQALADERRAFTAGEWLVFFQRWSADSAVRDCGASPEKVRVICPGANLALPADWLVSDLFIPPGPGRPLVLGFVGKDWKRKGLPFLLEVSRLLRARGLSTVVRCAGGGPDPLPDDASIENWGFIDKRQEPGRFLDFLRGCDFGCLFSHAEASSIAVLEFLHAGIPAAGFVVDGMTDLFPPEASLRFEPGTSADAIATQLWQVITASGKMNALREGARAWSPLLTWDRCVREWQELLRTGTVTNAVQPWRGLAACKSSA